MRYFTHSLDIRIQLCIVLFASLCTLFSSTFEAQSILFITSVVYILYMQCYKAFGIILCVGSIVALCSFAFSALLTVLIPHFPSVTFFDIAIPCIRMIVVSNVVFPLATLGKTHSLIASLQSIRLPFWIYFPLVVMVRFIPTFLTDIQQIITAIRLRGYPFSCWFCMRHPFLTLRLVGVPIIMCTLISADTLSIAATLKGIEPATSHIQYNTQKSNKKQWILFFCILFILSCTIILAEKYGAPITKSMH